MCAVNLDVTCCRFKIIQIGLLACAKNLERIDLCIGLVVIRSPNCQNTFIQTICFIFIVQDDLIDLAAFTLIENDAVMVLVQCEIKVALCTNTAGCRHVVQHIQNITGIIRGLDIERKGLLLVIKFCSNRYTLTASARRRNLAGHGVNYIRIRALPCNAANVSLELFAVDALNQVQIACDIVGIRVFTKNAFECQCAEYGIAITLTECNIADINIKTVFRL